MPILQYRGDKSVLIVDRERFQTICILGKKWWVFFQSYSYHPPIRVHHSLCSARLYRSSGRAKVVDRTADAPSSFESDVWRRFGVSRFNYCRSKLQIKTMLRDNDIFTSLLSSNREGCRSKPRPFQHP